MSKLKKRIGITLRTGVFESYAELRNCISDDWMKFLIQMNCVPILIPIHSHFFVSKEEYIDYLESFSFDGLILSNGNDVDYIYTSDFKNSDWISTANTSNSTNTSISINRLRDQAECALVEWALFREIPVMGVCRGLQLINCFFGGKLQDLSKLKTNIPHIGKSHILQLQGLTNFPKEHVSVNSFHNYGILNHEVAVGLNVKATCEDVVEMLVHEVKPIFGVQWHPERPGCDPDFSRYIMSGFLSSTDIFRNGI